jgi:uncharacterized protein YndB with AHSA1/START domain
MAAMTGSGAAIVTLPTDTQILITREFNAPRHLVYRAFTEPDLVRRWWSGEQGEVTSIESDLRVGGRWRYVMTANAGFEVGFNGEFTEIVPDERIVRTEIFEGMPDAGAVSTTTFSQNGDRTTVAILVQHLTRENRDAHVNSGMETGMQASMDKLEQVARAIG